MEKVMNGEELIAIIIRKDYHADGIQFFTPNEFSQQLAYMNRPAGHEIKPHTHNLVERRIQFTLETLLIRHGRVQVDFYTADRRFLESREVSSGDVLFLASGGHGFTMLEPTEMIEVKQGPYASDRDKTIFTPDRRVS